VSLFFYLFTFTFSALTLLVGLQEGHPARKNMGMVEVDTISPDGVAPSRMVSVSASVNLSLHHKVQKFSSGTGSPVSPAKTAEPIKMPFGLGC